MKAVRHVADGTKRRSAVKQPIMKKEEDRVIPCQITQKKEKMKPHLFRFSLNLECGIIRDGDEDISIFSLIGQAVSDIWPI